MSPPPIPVPPHRANEVSRIAARLRKARRVVLTTHINADGDGVGSEIALATWLEAQGSEVRIVNPTPFPTGYDFLLPDPNWVLDVSTRRAEEWCASCDLAVVLDTSEVGRIGRVKPLLDGVDTVVVDHHMPGDRPIHGLSLRDDGACATGELIFDLLAEAGTDWEPPVVDGIYVAILTDTGSFRYSNATPRCHRVTAALVEMGADPETLHQAVYGKVPLRRYRLLQACLPTLQIDPEGLVAWMMVPDEAYQEWAESPEDLEGLVDYPRSVDGVEVGLLFRGTQEGFTKVSFRSNGAVDVNALARSFEGGGHRKASGALVRNLKRSEAVERVVEKTRRAAREVRLSDDG